MSGLNKPYIPYLLAPLHREDEQKMDQFMESKYEDNFENWEEKSQVIKKERCSAKCISGTRKNLRCKRTVLSGKSCCAIHMRREKKHVQFSHLLNSNIIEIKNSEIEVKDASTQTDFSDESSDEELISTSNEELWIDSIPSYIS